MANQQTTEQLLATLTPQEREIALKALSEMSVGKSKILEDLKYSDYEEIPVDIETFVDDNRYLGNAWHDNEGKTKLYPYWRKELHKIFPNNLDTAYNNAIFSGSRGRGKSEIAVLVASYLLYRVLCLKDPIGFFRLKPTEKIVFAFMNIKLALAEEIGISKFQNTIQSSPWFLAHGELEGRTKKVWVPKRYNGQEVIDIKIGSQADDLIGLPIFFCLDGDTVIKTTAGDEKLVNLVGKSIKVTSVDHYGNLRISNICTVKPTVITDEEYQIKLEDNTVIKCTGNHRLLLNNCEYKEAQYLTTEDILYPHVNIKQVALYKLDKPKQFYDVINANPYNNFLIKTNSKYICSHNCFFDEISFIRNQDIDKQKAKANDMIDTAIGGMKTRFVYQGKNPTLLLLASSKRSEKSFLEEHMKKKLKSEKQNVYISDGPVWETKPEGTYTKPPFYVALGNKFLQSLVIPDNENPNSYINKGYKIIKVPGDFKVDFIDDIDRALCDFAGISSNDISKYISGAAWRDTQNPNIRNPFENDILEIGNAKDDDRQYSDYFHMEYVDRSLMNRPLYIHMDMSVSGDMTGIAGIWIKSKYVHAEGRKSSDELNFRLAFSVSIRAPKGYQISFDKNRKFIYWLKSKGFNIKGISTDTFQSVDTGQSLTAKGYNYKVISVDRVDPQSHICLPYQYFRSCIYERRIETYESEALTAEIIDLERNFNTGKIDHPDGGRKDVADAVCGATFNASQNAEQFAFDFGETLEDLVGVSTADNENNTKKQINIDFEQALQEMFTPNSIREQRKKAQEEGFLDFGNGPSTPYVGPSVSNGMLIW